MFFSVDSKEIPNGIMVTPKGIIDANTSVKLRKNLQNILQTKPKKFIVNLEGVKRIDSSGLATLIESFQNTKKYGGIYKLIINNQVILDIFKLARLDQVFDIVSFYDDSD